MQDDREYHLVVKTVAARYDAVEQAIRERHSYELPAIHALRLDRIYAPYADWVREGASAAEPASALRRPEDPS